MPHHEKKLSRKATRHTRSPSAALVNISLLQCGRGDSIIIKCIPAQWLLIDSNLDPERIDDVTAPILGSIDPRLLLLCVTHPHEDHIKGMNNIYSKLASAGILPSWFCDGFINPLEVVKALKSANRIRTDVHFTEVTQSYSTFLGAIAELVGARSVNYAWGYDGFEKQLTPAGAPLSVKLHVISPNKTLIDSCLGAVIQSGTAYPYLNRISSAFVLDFQAGKNRLAALFCGDSQATELNASWKHRIQDPSWRQLEEYIGFIKVGHHGSDTSNYDFITRLGAKAKRKVAVISAGRQPAPPHEATIRNYVNAGWEVYNTNRKRGRSPAPSARAGAADMLRLYEDIGEITYETDNVCFKWFGGNDLEIGPRRLRVRSHEAALYG